MAKLSPITTHAYYMSIALEQAEIAFEKGEIPIGAVMVAKHQIIAKAYNQSEMLQDASAHAEILAITAASEYLQSKYLNDCTLYVTLEPCMMCAGALHWSQIGTIVFGASDQKKGYTNYQPNLLHPQTQVLKGILENESKALIQKFFQQLRN